MQGRRRHVSHRVASRLRAEQSRLDQRLADAVDFGPRELDERRAHNRAWRTAEQHERLFHAIVHVGPRVRVEHLRERIDAVVERARGREVVRPHGLEERGLQIRDHAAVAREDPVAAEHQRGEQPRAVGGEYVDGPRQALQRADVHLVLWHVAGPVLDGADDRHLLAHLEERVARIALAGRERILKRDDRQVVPRT